MDLKGTRITSSKGSPSSMAGRASSTNDSISAWLDWTTKRTLSKLADDLTHVFNRLFGEFDFRSTCLRTRHKLNPVQEVTSTLGWPLLVNRSGHAQRSNRQSRTLIVLDVDGRERDVGGTRIIRYASSHRSCRLVQDRHRSQCPLAHRDRDRPL